MEENLFIIYFWLIGWVILSIGYYIYHIYINKDDSMNKKICAWRAFWTGSLSWICICFTIAFFMVGGICYFNDWIEQKLSK